MPYRGLHPGATWRKCDFQIHSPRDPQWTGSPHLPGGSTADEQARDEWADRLVERCIAVGLTAIAITDHHDFCFVEYVRRAIARAHADIWLFPGVEVTCDDAVQCLVLFDADSEADTWNRLFGGHLLSIAAPESEAATNPQADPCGKDIGAFLKEIAADAGLSGCSIVLPHASNEGAHKSVLRTGFHTRFKTLAFDGVYTDKAFNELDEPTKNKIWGKVPAWGSRRRGIIPTGDNRGISFDRLGANTCWIRLGEPTTEAIRQAVLADEARISYETPLSPAHRILGLGIDSTLTGPDFELSFNDGFTAIIGGRGTGKSAIIEYLRFGLGRSASDVGTDTDDSRSREKDLIADTLQDGAVVVKLERDGVAEMWSRSGARRDMIEVALPDGTREELTIPAAQERFRARAFYQKQLSTLVSDRRKAAEQITGIAAAESVDQRRLSEKEIAESKRKVQSVFGKVTDFWAAEAEHAQSLNAVNDLNRRIEAVKKRLEESGLSPENQKLLDAAPTYNLVEELTNEAKGAINADIHTLEAAQTAIPSIDPAQWSGARGFDEAVTFLTALETAKNQVRAGLAQATGALEALRQAHDQFAASFKARQNSFNLQHKAALEQEAKLKNLLDESTRLTGDLRTAEVAERRSATRLRGLEGASEELAATRAELTARLSNRRRILQEAATRVEAMSAGSLRASVQDDLQPEQYVSSLMETCEGYHVRDLESRCEQRVREMMENRVGQRSDRTEWDNATDTVLLVYKHKLQTRALSIEPGDDIALALEAALLQPLTPQQLNGIFTQLDEQRVVKMLTATREDQVVFEYHDATGYIPFEQASPGQQASALLNLLLNQEAGTLIIDQPEEDLDNKVIMKIVGLVQKTKCTRHLIFATHNPNFVVNGDADKVVSLTPSMAVAAGAETVPRVSVEMDGAIETPLVRSAITETMEGGQAAFELRSRKYLFKW